MELLSVVLAVMVVLISLRIFRLYRKSTRKVVFKRVKGIKRTRENGDVYSSVLVVGGQGLLGRKVVQALINEGIYKVHSLDLYIPPESKRLPVESYVQTDIVNCADVSRAIEGMDAVFLTASLQPHVAVSDSLMRKVNTEGAKNVVEACKKHGVKRLIYTSSVSVTMPKNPKKPHDLITEEEPFPEVPLNVYVESKGAAEKMVRAANGVGCLNTVALRLAGILGGKGNETVGLMYSPLVCYSGDGKFKIDYVDVDSVVRAQIIAEKKLNKEQQEQSLTRGIIANGVANGTSSGPSIGGKAYNITMSDKCSLKEMSEYIAELRGKPKPFGIPLFILWILTYINRLIYLSTGYVLLVLGPMHVEFQRAFNFLPDLANKELGWSEKLSWKEMAKKALDDY